DEWRRQDATLEVGYTRDGRWRLDLQPQPAKVAGPDKPLLDAESVVLLTGGAYGITADIARALAERYRPRLVLVGRSPLPADEAADTRDISDPAKLKQILIARLKAAGTAKVKPAEVDRVLRRLLKDREIRANLAALRAAGSEIDYHSLDVRDAAAFGDLIDGIYRRWGRLDGVLHGAGIIEDKLIRDKSLESFAAVYDTKVAPALEMSRRLRPEGLKFMLFFSSIAGRFGNAGQCDYSSANEVLNKLADSLSHAWPGVHVVSANWGPWQSGMVNEQILQFFAERDIHPIPLATGTQRCLEQLQRGSTGEPEVVITASLQQIAEQLRPRMRRDEARRQTAPAEAAASAATP
ncbi:MAG: SDR family NAD(P)-dependent oxidoreductase, partial [Zoogloea sp.]|nr:SDR family NAD(P)-dependent oxidoreductase [Zoogloea sp.]